MVLSDYSPAPIQQDWDIIKIEMQSKGVVIYGSEWTGWVPSDHGFSSADVDLASSSYLISNIDVQRTVVQGPTPRTYRNSKAASLCHARHARFCCLFYHVGLALLAFGVRSLDFDPIDFLCIWGLGMWTALGYVEACDFTAGVHCN